MRALANLSIGTRLTAGFALLITTLIGVAAIGFTKIDELQEDTEIILHDRYAKVALAQSIENEVNRQLRAMRTAMLVTEPALREKELAKIEVSAPVVARAIERLQASVHSEQGVAALKELVESRDRFKQREGQLIELIKAGKIDEGRSTLVSAVLPVQTAYLQEIEEFTQTQVDGMEQFGAMAAGTAQRAKTLM